MSLTQHHALVLSRCWPAKAATLTPKFCFRATLVPTGLWSWSKEGIWQEDTFLGSFVCWGDYSNRNLRSHWGMPIVISGRESGWDSDTSSSVRRLQLHQENVKSEQLGIKWFSNTLKTSQSHRSQCGRFYSQDKESKLGKHANITKKGYSCTDLLLLLSHFGCVRLCVTP